MKGISSLLFGVICFVVVLVIVLTIFMALTSTGIEELSAALEPIFGIMS